MENIAGTAHNVCLGSWMESRDGETFSICDIYILIASENSNKVNGLNTTSVFLIFAT